VAGKIALGKCNKKIASLLKKTVVGFMAADVVDIPA